MTGLALIFVLLFSPKVHRDMFLSLQNETNCTANQKTWDSVYLNIIKYTCTYIQYIIWILYNMIILSTVLKYLFLVSPFWVLSRWGGNSTHTWPAVDWTAEQWLLYTPHTWHQRSPECHLRSPCRASSRWPSVSPESLDHSGSSKQNRKCRSISEIHCVKYQVIIKHTSSGNIECYTDWHYLHESSNFLKRYI